ncbi:MAG TPA: 2'-5' RNA ligase family protein [Thermomicrobiales bacterium]|nr:2'-5' RNA ligase family protein [Thermomicrobiales bacterium]
MDEGPARLTPESGLLVPAPAAEAAVGRWRERHDPSAPAGIPAHITLLYPFVPPGQIDAALLADLRAFFAGVAPFPFALGRLDRFPGVLYLAPEPAAPFRDLIAALSMHYPQYPPYGGKHATIVPHLTVAHAADPAVLDAGMAAVAGALPLAAVADEAVLMEMDPAGRWHTRERFPFGRGRGA